MRIRTVLARPLLAIGCLLAGTDPIFAQQTAGVRTAESAQQFLIEMLERNKGMLGYSIGRFKNIGDNRPSPEYSEYYAIWTIERIEPVSRCLTRFHLMPGSFQAIGYQAQPANNVKVAPLATFDINWSKVTKVEAPFGIMSGVPGQGVRVTLADGKYVKFGYDLAYKNAARTEAAVAFLQENCLASTDTGF